MGMFIARLGHSVHTLAARIKQVLVWFLQSPDYGRELGARIVSGTGSGVIIRPVWKLRGRDRALYVRGRPDFRDFLSPSFPFLINPLHNLNPLTGNWNPPPLSDLEVPLCIKHKYMDPNFIFNCSLISRIIIQSWGYFEVFGSDKLQNKDLTRLRRKLRS